MRRFFLSCSLLLAVSLNAQSQAPSCCMGGMHKAGETAPIASNPIAEFAGTIAEVHLGVGQGMPYLVIQKDKETTRVYLGAMHYLIAQDFSPKTGQSVSARGYKVADGLIGSAVTLTAEKKTIKLRDDKGWPLWRGGPGRMAAPSQDPAKP